MKDQIVLINEAGKSQIDGKTIKHAFGFRQWDSRVVIAFTDGSWGFVFGNYDQSRPNFAIQDFITNDNYVNQKEILESLVAAEIISEEEVKSIRQKSNKDRRLTLIEEIGQMKRSLVSRETELVELEMKAKIATG